MKAVIKKIFLSLLFMIPGFRAVAITNCATAKVSVGSSCGFNSGGGNVSNPGVVYDTNSCLGSSPGCIISECFGQCTCMRSGYTCNVNFVNDSTNAGYQCGGDGTLNFLCTPTIANADCFVDSNQINFSVPGNSSAVGCDLTPVSQTCHAGYCGMFVAGTLSACNQIGASCSPNGGAGTGAVSPCIWNSSCQCTTTCLSGSTSDGNGWYTWGSPSGSC